MFSADMFLEINELLEESFNEINKNLDKNTKLLEKVLGELKIIKNHLNLE